MGRLFFPHTFCIRGQWRSCSWTWVTWAASSEVIQLTFPTLPGHCLGTGEWICQGWNQARVKVNLLVTAFYKLELWPQYEGSNNLSIFFLSSEYHFMQKPKRTKSKAENTVVDLRKNISTPRNYNWLINEDCRVLTWGGLQKCPQYRAAPPIKRRPLFLCSFILEWPFELFWPTACGRSDTVQLLKLGRTWLKNLWNLQSPSWKLKLLYGQTRASLLGDGRRTVQHPDHSHPLSSSSSPAMLQKETFPAEQQLVTDSRVSPAKSSRTTCLSWVWISGPQNCGLNKWLYVLNH